MKRKAMGYHPVNLGFRFILEMIALDSFGLQGWRLGSGWTRFVFAAVFVLIAAALWGVFRVPGDASHSGEAPVQVPGLVRLILELGIFSVAVYFFYLAGQPTPAILFGVSVALHYLLSWDRVLWLIRS
jgi:hypothetical protein